MKKALMVAGAASMIQQFNLNNIEILEKLGYQVDIAANFDFGSTFSFEKAKKLQNKLLNENKNVYNISFTRDLSDIKNMLKSYKQIKNLIETNHYTLIHCHMPICSAITRLACKRERIKDNLKIIYTAHGFHFYRGAPLKNWLMFYPIEKHLAKYTDGLITINSEDYRRAQRFSYYGRGKAYYIPGVGVNTGKYRDCKVDKKKKRKELDIPEDAFVLLSVGELCKRKNHETIIKAIASLNKKDIYYLICGEGKLEDHLIQIIEKKNITNRVKLLGFRNDIHELCNISDIYIFPSKREGLGLAAIEGMASGLPLISSNVNGILDYSINGKTGYAISPDNSNLFAEKILYLIEHPDIAEKMGAFNSIQALKYDIKTVEKKMKNIYEDITGDI